MNAREVLFDLLYHAIVMMRVEANPAQPDTRAVQEWASAFHNVPVRMQEVMDQNGDLQVVLDELWNKNQHLPRVRDGIVARLDMRGLDAREVFRSD